MLSRISRAVPDLSRAEKQVATWVLEHPKQATSATLAHIANECGTSEPTVLRFCRNKLGHEFLGQIRSFTTL